jgi:hypothetical protein
MTHDCIIETRSHMFGHAWRCTCGRPQSTWMESEATARAAWRKHAAAADQGDPPAACPHSTFTADVSVHRIGDPPSHIMAEVRVSCASCGVPFRFLGPPTGLAFGHPTVDLPATTLHAPIAAGERTEMPDQIRVEVPS